MKSKLLLLFSMLWLGVQAQDTPQANTGHLDKGHFSFGISSNGLGFVSSKTTHSGNQNYYQDNSKNYSVFILGFDAGYLVTNQFQVGLFTDLNMLSVNSSSKTKHFGIGPKFNYYFKSGSDLVPFASVSGGHFSEDSVFFKRKGYTWDIGAGLSYFLNDYIALQALLQYQNKTFDQSYIYICGTPGFDPNFSGNQTGLKTSQLNFNIGFSIFF